MIDNNNYNSLVSRILAFREARDWKQFHNPKNLAEAISLEANEVLEQYQWKDFAQSIEHSQKNREEIAEEIADVAIYLIYLADTIGVDLLESIDKKMKKNESKYPVEKAKGRADKYNKL